MAPQQKRSFLPYTRGINPEDLRLGSLYLDPLDPDDGLESKRFEYQEDLDQEEYEKHIQKWIRREQKDERGCSLDFELSADSSLALKFSDFVKAEGHSNKTVTATLEGKSGRRLKIKKPEKFLKEEILVQDGAKEWIRTQASISFRGRIGMHAFKAPEIWMVTGVQLVTGGDVRVGSSRAVGGSGGAAVDAGAIAGGPPGHGTVGGTISHKNNSKTNNSYRYDDERVWAAQFMKINIEYGKQEDKTLKTRDGDFVPADITMLQLEDIADLGARGVRASREERALANGQTAQPPKPVARIVAEEEEEISDDDDIQLSDHLYVDGMKDTDWKMYDECLQYLADARNQGRPISPEPRSS